MTDIAKELVAEAVAEIALRDPGFLDRQEVTIAPAAVLAEAYLAHPLFAGWGASGIEGRLIQGQGWLEAQGVHGRVADTDPLLSRMLADSVMDAFAAEEGLIGLRPAPRRSQSDVMDQDYERGSVSGTDYIRRKAGERWLLVVNAIGVPLSLWSRLIGDPRHEDRVLAVAPSAGDLLQGGMAAEGGVDADVERIRRVLDAEKVDRLTVVGWCSGGRIAVELAAREPDRVDLLVLASCSFRGAGTDEPAPTRFEEDAGEIFAGVRRSPATAGFLSNMLVQSQGATPETSDAAALFRLPRKEHGKGLTAPFASAEALVAYSNRLAADRGHATAEALARVRAPIMAVGGPHDHIISNAATLAVLKAGETAVAAIGISGAGHYAHDLQYPYFRMILDDARAGCLTSSARTGELA